MLPDLKFEDSATLLRAKRVLPRACPWDSRTWFSRNDSRVGSLTRLEPQRRTPTGLTRSYLTSVTSGVPRRRFQRNITILTNVDAARPAPYILGLNAEALRRIPVNVPVAVQYCLDCDKATPWPVTFTPSPWPSRGGAIVAVVRKNASGDYVIYDILYSGDSLRNYLQKTLKKA